LGIDHKDKVTSKPFKTFIVHKKQYKYAKIKLIFMKKFTIPLLIICLLLAASVAFFALVYNKKPSKISRLDVNTNTYAQNKQNGDNTTSDKKDGLSSQDSSVSSSAITVTNRGKPTLSISALKAPSGVDIDFICYGKQGDYCFVTLTNTTNDEIINTNKVQIKSDRSTAGAANISWKTKAGKWSVIASVGIDNGQVINSDASIIEVFQ
jgi:hypothetical protein